jgi:PAS domain S-box-containing protein
MDSENKSFLSRVFDSVADPVAVYDRDYRIVRVNAALTRLFGMPPEALIGRHCYEVFYGRRNRCEECHVHEAFESGEPCMREKCIRLPDGRTRCFEVHSYPVKEPNGDTIQAVEHVRDITERKDLERKLKESEGRYRSIVEMAREGIYTLDAEARVVFANQCLAEILGYRLDEILGRSIFEFMDEEAKELARVQLERRRQGLADIYELRLIGKNGQAVFGLISVTPLLINGAFAGSTGILTDITCLKQTEERLKAAKVFNERIINSITDNLIVIDAKTYQIVQANDSFLARIGEDSKECVFEKTCYEVMLQRTVACETEGVQCPVEETARLKRSVLIERVYPDARGQPRLLQISSYPFFDSDGEVELVIRLERDITEKRKMEETLAFRSRELQKAQHQLESLCVISRQVSTKASVRELIHFIGEIVWKAFPGAELVFFVFNAHRNHFLALSECEANVVEPLRRRLLRLEQAGLISEFVGMVSESKGPQVVTSTDCGEIAPFESAIIEGDQTWFGFPIVTQNQCIGHFFAIFETLKGFSAEDLQFCQALFEQVAGHLRHLVLYEAEIDHLRRQVSERVSYGEIIGQSKKMQEVYELIDLVSSSDATVLITGENGTGKELVAQAIHWRSHRSKGPFVVANCSAYSPTLLESELFGHEKGAFTGAISQKKGRIERAQGGTLFLDEIGDVAPATQILLLRFLQDHCFERVGGEKTIKADVRVLAATNCDLRHEIQSGRFRDDLYYRLNVIAVHLPPLRERKEDIPLLAQHFLRKFNLKEGKKIHKFSSNAMQLLMDYEWPGNVRQLENGISHAVILSQGEIVRARHLPGFLREALSESALTSLTENERNLILRVLKESSWNKHDAARRLGVSRSTLYSKIRRYGLERTPRPTV